MLRDLLPLLLFTSLVAPCHAFAQTDTGGTEALPLPQNRLAVSRKRTSEDIKPQRAVDWNLEFASEFEGEEKDEALAVMTGLGLDIRFNFGDSLKLKVSPVARFYSARSQNRFDSDNFEDRISLYEGYLRYAPFTSFAASVGTHAQSFIDNSQLVSGSRSFPGVVLLVTPLQGEQQPILTLEEAVPTSYTYNALREDKEPLPGVRVIDFTLKSEWSRSLTSKLQAGRIAWRNLPTKTAFNSATLGNTIVGDLAPGTQFAYGFQTDYVQAGVAYCETCTFGVFGTYKRSRNGLAPLEAADAQLFGGGVSFRSLQTITRLSISDFFAESDVTPGQYASSSMGNNNRKGLSANLDLEIPSMDLKIKSQLIQAKPINPGPYQFDMTSFYLGVETDGHFL